MRRIFALVLVAACGSTNSHGIAPPGGGKADGADLDPDADRNRNCPGGCSDGSVCDTQKMVCVTEPGAPTLQSPISGARTTGMPVVRWTSSSMATDSLVKVCRDVSCFQVVATLTGANTATLPAPLARGAYFVRGFGRAQQPDGHFVTGALHTSTRVIFANGGAGPTVQPLGLEPDFDRDGHADLLRVDAAPDNASYTQIVTAVLGNGTTASATGGWYADGPVSDYAFGTFATATLDLDGNGRSEIVTIKQLTANPGFGADVPPALATVQLLRYEVDVDGKLVLVQSLDYAIPPGETPRNFLSLGDLDGDGYADVGLQLALPQRVVAAPFGGTLSYGTGVELAVFHGSATGLVASGSVRFALPIDQQQPTTQLAILYPLGDVDGDGYPDLAAVVQPPDPPARSVAGQLNRVDVYAGDPATPFTRVITSVAQVDDVTPLGDVNGDGFADFASVRYSWPTFTYPDPNNTATYVQGIAASSIDVVYGGASVTVTTPWTFPIDVVPSCSNGAEPGYDQFPRGASVVGGGDLDGDGFDDVILIESGAHGVGSGAQLCQAQPVTANAFYSSGSGVGATPAQAFTNPAGASFAWPMVNKFVGGLVPGASDEVMIGTPSGYQIPERLDVFGGPRGQLTSLARM